MSFAYCFANSPPSITTSIQHEHMNMSIREVLMQSVTLFSCVYQLKLINVMQEYICRVKQCPSPFYSDMEELGEHIDKAHIGIVQIPCPFKGKLYSITPSPLSMDLMAAQNAPTSLYPIIYHCSTSTLLLHTQETSTRLSNHWTTFDHSPFLGILLPRSISHHSPRFYLQPMLLIHPPPSLASAGTSH